MKADLVRVHHPWSGIVGMRNRLIHGYYDINLDIVWETVKENIPPLKVELEKIIEHERCL